MSKVEFDEMRGREQAWRRARVIDPRRGPTSSSGGPLRNSDDEVFHFAARSESEFARRYAETRRART
jgi:hypothetical protein